MVEKEILLEEVVSLLQTELASVSKRVTLPSKSIRLMPDERCPPTAGEEFIGVYGGTSTNLNIPQHPTKRIEYALSIGITRRSTGVPREQAGENILTENALNRMKASILLRARQIIDIMLDADGWTLTNNVNSQLVADGYGGMFVLPLGLIDLDPQLEPKGPEHWSTEDDDDPLRPSGYFMQLQFGGAEYHRSSSPS